MRLWILSRRTSRHGLANPPRLVFCVEHACTEGPPADRSPSPWDEGHRYTGAQECRVEVCACSFCVYFTRSTKTACPSAAVATLDVNRCSPTVCVWSEECSGKRMKEELIRGIEKERVIALFVFEQTSYIDLPRAEKTYTVLFFFFFYTQCHGQAKTNHFKSNNYRLLWFFCFVCVRARAIRLKGLREVVGL